METLAFIVFSYSEHQPHDYKMHKVLPYLGPRFFRELLVRAIVQIMIRASRPGELLYPFAGFLQKHNVYLVLGGAPFTGKDATAEACLRHLGEENIVQLVMSSVLKEFIASNSAKAQFEALKLSDAERAMRDGGLVPDEIVKAAFKWKLEQIHEQKLVLKNGVLRTPAQAELHVNTALERGQPFAMVCLSIRSPEVLKARIKKRHEQSPGRSDNGTEQHRYAVYHKTTAPAHEKVREFAQMHDNVHFAEIVTDKLTPEQQALAALAQVALRMMFRI